MKWINNKHGQTDIDLFIRQTHVNEDFQTLCDIFDLDIQEGSVEPFNVTLGKSKNSIFKASTLHGSRFFFQSARNVM